MSGEGKTVNVYIALTEVSEFNGFEFLDGGAIAEDLAVNVTREGREQIRRVNLGARMKSER